MRNYHFRHTGVLFPDALIKSAGYKLPFGCRVSGAAECLRCQFAGVASLRSALHSNRTFITRGLYLLTGAALLAGNCAAVNVELNESGVRN